MKQQRLDDYSMYGLLKSLDEMDSLMRLLELDETLDQFR